MEDRAPGLVAGAIFAAAGFTAGCGSSLPGPALGPPLTGLMIEVPYPPSAARVETIPPQPRDDAVWVDGQWSWEVKRWRWERGGWVVPPKHAYFSPWQTFRRSDGVLLFVPATWATLDQREIAAPPVIDSAETTPTTTTEGSE